MVLAARGRERLQEAAADVSAARRGNDQHVSWVAVDVADASAVGEAGEDAVRRLGGVDLLVNAAGITHPGYVQDLPDEVFRRVMETNYFGAVRVTRAMLPRMRAQRSGHVSFVSSVAGFLGVFGYSAYAPTKFALAGFADCLRQEVAGDGIQVSVLFPPDTDTPQLAAEIPLRPPETTAVAGGIRVATPEKVARAYVRGIARGQRRILPGLGVKLAYFAHRYAPAAVEAVMRWQVAGARRRSAS